MPLRACDGRWWGTQRPVPDRGNTGAPNLSMSLWDVRMLGWDAHLFEWLGRALARLGPSMGARSIGWLGRSLARSHGRSIARKGGRTLKKWRNSSTSTPCHGPGNQGNLFSDIRAMLLRHRGQAPQTSGPGSPGIGARLPRHRGQATTSGKPVTWRKSQIFVPN